MRKVLVFLTSLPAVLAHETGGERVVHVSMWEETWHYLSTNGKWIFGILFILAVFAFAYWMWKKDAQSGI